MEFLEDKYCSTMRFPGAGERIRRLRTISFPDEDIYWPLMRSFASTKGWNIKKAKKIKICTETFLMIELRAAGRKLVVTFWIAAMAFS